MHSDEPRVTGIAEPLPSDEGPRPAQDGTLLAADGGVDTEAGDQVPGAPRRESQDGGGAVHGPGDVAHAAGDAVDEGVLKVRIVRAREVLGEGAEPPVLGEGSPHRRLEWVGGLVAAALERNMFEIWGVGDDSGEDTGEHGAVNRVGLGVAPAMARGPRDVEDVGDVREGCQGLGDRGVISEVDVQVDNGGYGVVVGGEGGGGGSHVPGWHRAAGERVDLLT